MGFHEKGRHIVMMKWDILREQYKVFHGNHEAMSFLLLPLVINGLARTIQNTHF